MIEVLASGAAGCRCGWGDQGSQVGPPVNDLVIGIPGRNRRAQNCFPGPYWLVKAEPPQPFEEGTPKERGLPRPRTFPENPFRDWRGQIKCGAFPQPLTLVNTPYSTHPPPARLPGTWEHCSVLW